MADPAMAPGCPEVERVQERRGFFLADMIFHCKYAEHFIEPEGVFRFFR